MTDFPNNGELSTGQRGTATSTDPKRGRINTKNVKRSAEAHMRCFDGGIDHDGWIRQRSCLLCRASLTTQATPTQAAHVVARGMGAAKGKWYDLVPLCDAHHDEQGGAGNEAIRAKYGVGLVHAAQVLARGHLVELGAIAGEANRNE